MYTSLSISGPDGRLGLPWRHLSLSPRSSQGVFRRLPPPTPPSLARGPRGSSRCVPSCAGFLSASSSRCKEQPRAVSPPHLCDALPLPWECCLLPGVFSNSLRQNASGPSRPGSKARCSKDPWLTAALSRPPLHLSCAPSLCPLSLSAGASQESGSQCR